MMPLAVARAEVAAAEGDLAGALVTMQGAAATAGPTPPPPAGWPFVWTWGRLLLDAGAPAPAGLAPMVGHLCRVSPHRGWQAVAAAQAAALATNGPAVLRRRSGSRAAGLGRAGDALAAAEGLVMEEADARLRAAEEALRGGHPEGARADSSSHGR